MEVDVDFMGWEVVLWLWVVCFVFVVLDDGFLFCWMVFLLLVLDEEFNVVCFDIVNKMKLV